MKATYIKNILNLLKKSVDTFPLYCKNENMLIVYLETEDLVYNFEMISNNKLIPDNTYILNVSDLSRLFKYIKADSFLHFTDCEMCVKLEVDETSCVKQILHIQKIITQSIREIYKNMKDYDTLVSREHLTTVSVKLNDFSRIIKSLKNSSDNYEIAFHNHCCTISNIEAVIPITYNLTTHQECNSPRESSIIISNNVILKLNKLSSDNTFIEIGIDYLCSPLDIQNEIKWYIHFWPRLPI